MAIGASVVNAASYSVLALSSSQHASHILPSLYCAAALSAYLFMCIIQKPGYELRLEPDRPPEEDFEIIPHHAPSMTLEQAKKQKYRLILEQLSHAVALPPPGHKLHAIITGEGDVRDRYRAFVCALREACQQGSAAGGGWAHALALHRFARIDLQGYCKELVELVSGSFNAPIDLNNFWEMFEARTRQVARHHAEQSCAERGALFWQRFQGRINSIDFLRGSNVPYVYGQLNLQGHVTTILRHGTPIAPTGFFGTSQVTADYVAFIDAAGANILHLIAEDGLDYFEGVRVKARLALSAKRNFFPWAIRFDGDFINPPHYQSKAIEQVKEEFVRQMYGQNTGYVVPQKLQYSGLSQAEFRGYMGTVQQTFFKGQVQLNTLADFQAFVVLTYAEATLSLCQQLNIAYLEAICKDDIDRGGAMKAIIVLLHLYKTGRITDPTELEKLMINIIAAPLIVKKQPILADRALFIKNVLDVMRRA